MPEKKVQEAEPAAQQAISLSQAILAPLSAVMKAQVHAARATLNMLLQIGYPHQPPPGGGMEETEPGAPLPPVPAGKPQYTIDFIHEHMVDGRLRRQRVSIPTLALVPVAPLAVESASFSFEMAVKEIGKHSQLKASEEKEANDRRPWYLVHEPISIRGMITQAGTEKDAEASREAALRVEIKVGSMRMPAGLDRLLTTLTQMVAVEDLPVPPNNANP